MSVLFIFLTLLYYNTCECKRYDGYQLLRGVPGSEEQLEFFKNLTQAYDVNIWRSATVVKKPVDFIISPDHVDILKNKADTLNIDLTMLNNNIQSAIDNQSINTYSRRNTETFNWLSFYRYNDIVNWMKDLANKHPKKVTVFSIGKTIQNRNIMCLKLVHEKSKKSSSVVFEGGMHAREWASSAVVTYLINTFINVHTKGFTGLKEIAFNYVFYFIPCMNPDGYEYSHTADRMWRKNRRGGYGIDLNRNFDAKFGTVGVSKTDKKSEEYCGPSAFSEPETRSLKNFLKGIGHISHYMSFHCYGQLFIIPYAYTKKKLDNFKEMEKIAKVAMDRLKSRYGTEYTIGTAYEAVGYEASGVSACYAKKAHNIRYVGYMELRDTGDYGFVMPKGQILPTCIETMEGVLSVIKPRISTLSNQKNNVTKDIAALKENGQSKIVLNDIIISINVLLVVSFHFK